MSKTGELKSENVGTLPAACTVRTETMEGSIDGVSDLTKHIREVEHVWRATLNASGRFRVRVHVERKGWLELGRLGERRASVGDRWMMVIVHRFISYALNLAFFWLRPNPSIHRSLRNR